MVKPYFTRKNLMVIALSFFYALAVIFTGLCIDADHALISKKNMINIAAAQMGFKPIAGGTAGLVTLILVGVYTLVFVICFLYIRRYAIVNGKKKYGLKMILLYIGVFLLCALLSLGVGALIQININESIGTLMRYIMQAILLGSLIYILLFGLVGFATMLVVNFISVDKPFKFWNNKESVTIGDELEAECDVDITSSFDSKPTEVTASSNATIAQASGGGSDLTGVKRVEELDDREKVFPALSKMDIDYDGYQVLEFESDSYNLEEICERFRNYLAKEEKLYFDIDTIRLFISGFAASHFMILEGLSGTGKSSLPRYFSKFCGANLLFIPVQTTWRDKSSLFGYFNDFSKTYNETDFLLGLYHACYNPDQIHIFVLDEMNISRVEYYFADLLSVLEYPEDEWRIRLMQIPHGFIPPARLDDGMIQIMPNAYFVGTANKDDSTFSITDKVYDRAITIDFDYRNEPFDVESEANTIKLSSSHLKKLYNEALEKTENRMTEDDYKKLLRITDFIYEQFDLTFGNRILNQIETLVPVFVECGGRKEDAIDFLLSRKVLAKLEGRFEEYVRGALKQLLQLLAKVYGSGALKRSEKVINTLIRRL